MKNKIIMSALALLFTFGVAWAQNPGGRPGAGPGMKGNRMMDPIERLSMRLDLSTEQISSIESIHLAYAKKNQPIRNQVNELEAKLQTLTSTDTPDQKKVNAIVGEINDLRGELFLNRTNCQLEIRSELDESQKLRFDQMKSEKGRGNFKRGR